MKKMTKEERKDGRIKWSRKLIHCSITYVIDIEALYFT